MSGGKARRKVRAGAGGGAAPGTRGVPLLLRLLQQAGGGTGMLQGPCTRMFRGPCTGMLWDPAPDCFGDLTLGCSRDAIPGCSGDLALGCSGDPALGCSGTQHWDAPGPCAPILPASRLPPLPLQLLLMEAGADCTSISPCPEFLQPLCTPNGTNRASTMPLARGGCESPWLLPSQGTGMLRRQVLPRGRCQ